MHWVLPKVLCRRAREQRLCLVCPVAQLDSFFRVANRWPAARIPGAFIERSPDRKTNPIRPRRTNPTLAETGFSRKILCRALTQATPLSGLPRRPIGFVFSNCEPLVGGADGAFILRGSTARERESTPPAKQTQSARTERTQPWQKLALFCKSDSAADFTDRLLRLPPDRRIAVPGREPKLFERRCPVAWE